jgi:hypothetical protein
VVFTRRFVLLCLVLDSFLICNIHKDVLNIDARCDGWQSH